MSSHDVVIVEARPARLAGLACAQNLTGGQGLDVRILEAGDAVGGRVRTDHVDGFILDRGFQVLNTAYPALRSHVDLDALDLQAFDPAVGIHLNGERVTVVNPVQPPSGAATALGLPVGGIRGKAPPPPPPSPPLPPPPRRHPAPVLLRGAAGAGHDHLAPVHRPDGADVRPGPVDRPGARHAATADAASPAAHPRTAPPADPGAPRHGPGVDTDDGARGARAVVVATDAWTASRLLPRQAPAPAARGVTAVDHGI